MAWLRSVLNAIPLIEHDTGPLPEPCWVFPCPPDTLVGNVPKAVQVPCDVKDCIEKKLEDMPDFCDFLDNLIRHVNLLNFLISHLAELQSRLEEINHAIDGIEQFLIDSGCDEFYQGNDGPGTDPQFDKDADVDPVCAVYYTQLYRLEEVRDKVQDEIDTATASKNVVQEIVDAMQQEYSNVIYGAAEECRNEQLDILDQKTV